MNDIERALSYLKEGYSCSQSILLTYGKRFGISRENAIKVASSFGGGIGGMGDICGAVSGAFMAIGLKYGKTNIDEKGINEKSYEKVREFVEKFKGINGAIKCNDLLGYDISTSEGRQLAKEKNIFKTVCPKAVQTSAEILEELL